MDDVASGRGPERYACQSADAGAKNHRQHTDFGGRCGKLIAFLAHVDLPASRTWNERRSFSPPHFVAGVGCQISIRFPSGSLTEKIRSGLTVRTATPWL